MESLLAVKLMRHGNMFRLLTLILLSSKSPMNQLQIELIDIMYLNLNQPELYLSKLATTIIKDKGPQINIDVKESH